MSADAREEWEILEADSMRKFHNKVARLSAAGTFLDGFDLAVIAVALPVLTQQWHLGTGMNMAVAASAVVGMLIGSAVVGRLTDKLGRKKMYFLDLLFFVVFAAATALSQDVWQLITFRFLLGVGLGADYPISGTLLAEFAPARRRGALLCRLGAMWFVGSAAAYIIGIAFEPLGNEAWRYMLGLGAVIAAVVMYMRRSIPESPRWLEAGGRGEEATSVINRMNEAGFADADHTFAEASMTEAFRTAKDGPADRPWRRLFTRPLLRWTLFTCGFWAMYTMMYYGITIYTPTILNGLVNTDARWQAYLGSAVVGLLGVTGAVIGISLVDRIGRRPLIIGAYAATLVMLLLIALITSPPIGILTLLFAFAVMFANSGPGILDFVYPTELFPTDVRATGSGIATSVSRIGGLLGVLVFPQLIDHWGVSHAIWMFVGSAVVGTLVCVFLAPETKGRTLEELESDVAQGALTRRGVEVP